jgi:hypothetical protein
MPIPAETSSESFWISDRTSENDFLNAKTVALFTHENTEGGQIRPSEGKV